MAVIKICDRCKKEIKKVQNGDRYTCEINKFASDGYWILDFSKTFVDLCQDCYNEFLEQFLKAKENV